MKRKIQLAILMTGIFLVSVPSSLVRAADYINMDQKDNLSWNRHRCIRTVTYECQGELQEYDFEDEITVDGTKYRLQDSSYEVTDEVKPEIEKAEKTVSYQGLTKQELDELKTELEENGVTYTLSESDIKEEIQTEDISSYQMSGLVYEEPEDYKQEDVIEYDSPVTGEVTQQTLPFEGMELVQPFEWQDGFEMNLTFEVFDADVFQVGTELLVLDKERPVLTDTAEKTLLSSVGLPPESFTVDNLIWVSNPYEVDGITYRDAKVTGKQYVGEYRYNYHNASAETGSLYDLTAIYTIDEEDYEAQVEAATIYKVTADAQYQAAVPLTQIDILLLVGIALFLLLFVLFLLFLNKKKKRETVQQFHVTKDSGVVNQTSDDFLNDERR